MELSKYLRDYSRTIPGKQQLLIGAYAKALEIIPRQLCDNAGFDATNILNKLRAKHAQVGGSPSCPRGGVCWHLQKRVLGSHSFDGPSEMLYGNVGQVGSEALRKGSM